MRHSPGYSVVELLIVVGIIFLLAAASFVAFYSLNQRKSLDTSAEELRAELDNARALTLDSKNADQWGIHVASTSVTLFEGSSYNAAASSNVVSSLASSVQVSGISLQGGGSDIVFDRLTGATSKYGSVVLSLVSSSTISRTIKVYATGIADIQ